MIDKLRQHLKTQGYSVTPPRVAVFAYLQEHDPAAITDIIRDHLGRIDQASVYRTLALYKELGVARDVIVAGRKMIELTDSFDSHHHHISCLTCGRSVTIEDASLEERLRALAQANGITPVSHQIEVSGICADCRNKR